MAAFDLVTTPTPSGDHFTFDVPTGWKQQRGAYGGLVIAVLVRAIEAKVADPARKVRTVTAELAGPLELAPSTITVDILRTGSSVTVARATITQADGVKAHAVAVLAASRKVKLEGWQHLAPPEAPPWEQVPAVPWTPAFPEFAQNFEWRVVKGFPMSGQAPHCIGWVRPQDPGTKRDAGYLAALADVWWPGAYVTFKQLRPIATISYTLELLGDLEGLDPAAPLLYRGVVPVLVEDGYFTETRELWGADGRLIARNHQTLVVIA